MNLKPRNGVGGQTLVIWLGMLGVTTYNFQPFLVGGFVSLLEMSEAQAGMVAAVNMLGVCIGLAVATIRVQRWNVAALVLAGLLTMLVGNAVSALLSWFEPLLLARFVTGFGEGLALSAAISVVNRFANPDRLFALIMFGMSFYGMVGLLLLPHVMGAWGLPGTFLGVAVLCLVTLPWFRGLPTAKPGDVDQAMAGPAPVGPGVALVLLALTLVYVACNGVWAYFERIGAAIGISNTDIGIALSAGLFASMVGALLAAVLGERFGRRWPMVSGLVLCAGSVVVLLIANDFFPYTFAAMLLFGSTGFAVPYFLGQLAEFDPSGKLPIAGLLTVFLGNFIGPALGAGLVANGGYTALLLMATAIFLLALGLTVAALRVGNLRLSLAAR